MTREEITRMGYEAGLFNQHNEDLLQDKEVMAQFERFVALVAEKEQDIQFPEAITIWNKAIDAAASKAHGVGDDGLYYQIKDLKK